MTKLKDKESADLKTLKKYTRKNFRPLWVSNYYDRPLSGLGQILPLQYVRYEVYPPSQYVFDDYYWKYIIAEMSQTQIDNCIHNQLLFEEYFGDDWRLNEKWNRTPKTHKGKGGKTWIEVQEMTKDTKNDLLENEIIGWFTWTDAK